MTKNIRQIRIEGNIAYVPLTRGYFAVIDAEDVPIVCMFNWYADVKSHTVYARRRARKSENKSCVSMHREIMDAPIDLEVDHINGDGLNNRRRGEAGNLRLATHNQNMRNHGKHKNNTSGVRGVSWHVGKKRWQAQIRFNGKNFSLGKFDSIGKAAEAYDDARARLHGEFARNSNVGTE